MVQRRLYYACLLLDNIPFNGYVSSAKVAKECKVPVAYAQVLCKLLTKRGLLVAKRGRHGGGVRRASLYRHKIIDVAHCFGPLTGFEKRLLRTEMEVRHAVQG